MFTSSGTLTQAIRNFAKSLESWLTAAMSDFPHDIVRTKVSVFQDSGAPVCGWKSPCQG